MNRGARNLLILGSTAILITLIASGISLFVYHQSGDIYLDRSRPGFLPDEKEADDVKNEENQEFIFSDSGTIDQTTLDEYLNNFKTELNSIEKIPKPFDDFSLSDEHLGLPAE